MQQYIAEMKRNSYGFRFISEWKKKGKARFDTKSRKVLHRNGGMKMQKTLLKNLGRRYLCLILSIVLGIVFNASASAETIISYELGSGETIYQLDDLVNKYKEASNTYNKCILEYEIEQYNSDLATENYSTLDAEFDEAVNKLGQLKELKASYLEYRETIDDADILAEIDSQIDTIDAQIEQYSSSVRSYKVSMSEAKLQEEISQFYKKDQALIRQEAGNKLTDEFLKKCYSLILLKEKSDYYNAYEDYLNTVFKIENIKYQKGLTTLFSLEAVETKLTNNELEADYNEQTYLAAYSDILCDAKADSNIRIILPLSFEEKEYSLEDTVTRFENNNSNLLQLKHLKECYQNYLNSNYGSYTLYKQIQLRIKDYQLQYDELKADIEAYVSNAIYSYKGSYRTLSLAKQELKLAIENYNIIQTKKDHKKATVLDISKAEYEIKAAQVSYYQSIYDIIIWEDILENNLYGITP